MKRTTITWLVYFAFVALMVGLWALIVGSTASAAESERPSYSASREFVFDIPAQPLASALDAYSATTGLEILYGSDIASSRRSSAVRGAFTAAAALQQLLGGTNLSARAIAQNAVTVEGGASAPASTFQPAPDSSPHRYFYGLIQTDVRRIFCQDDEIRPGHYRAVLKFMVAADGQIRQSTLLGTTGSEERDRAITRALDATSLEAPPPADLPQPIMMVILPQSSGKPANCPSHH